MFGFGAFGAVFAVFLGVFVVLFVLVVAFMVTSATRGRRVLKQAGLDPLAAEAQLAARAAGSQLLAPQRSLEERLRELDDLRSRGVITDAEHATARATALAGG